MRKSEPQHPRAVPAGFTLAEILISLLVFSLAALVLIALFPLAHRTQKSSEEETRSALIASDIMEAMSVRGTPGMLHVAVSASNGELLWEELSPSNATSCCIAYDSTCLPKRKLPVAEATNPILDKESAALAFINIMPGRTVPNLVQVEVVVASPPAAPEEGRTAHRYVRLFPIP